METQETDAYRIVVVRRIIDANVNRAAEGLRVIEELARYCAGDERLFMVLKDLRHAVRRLPVLFGVKPETCRDVASDPGGRLTTMTERERSGLGGIARANLHRTAEALRTIEEFGKLLRPDATDRVKELRFRLYRVETALLGGTDGSAGLPAGPFLYGFVDRGYVPPGEAGLVAAKLVAGRCGVIQYRAKEIDRDEMLLDIAEVLAAARSSGVPVLVNDDPALAAETGADGVHLGPRDPSVSEARDLLGPSRIVGVSVKSRDDLGRIPLDLVDYVAVGSIFPTATKRDAIVGGIGLLADIRARTRLPVIAIGGITPRNAGEVLRAGADALAVVSAILCGDIDSNCAAFHEALSGKG